MEDMALVYIGLLKFLLFLGIILNVVNILLYILIVRNLVKRESNARIEYYNKVFNKVDFVYNFNPAKYLGYELKEGKMTSIALEKICLSPKFIRDYELEEEAYSTILLILKASFWERITSILFKVTFLVYVIALGIVVGNILLLSR